MTAVLDALRRWFHPPIPEPDAALVAREQAAEAEFDRCLTETQRKRLSFDKRPNARATIGDIDAELEAQRAKMRKAFGHG